MPEHKKMTEHVETVTSANESKTRITQSTENEQTQSEATNQSKIAGTHEQTKKATALVSLKQKMEEATAKTMDRTKYNPIRIMELRN